MQQHVLKVYTNR